MIRWFSQVCPRVETRRYVAIFMASFDGTDRCTSDPRLGGRQDRVGIHFCRGSQRGVAWPALSRRLPAPAYTRRIACAPSSCALPPLSPPRFVQERIELAHRQGRCADAPVLPAIDG